MKLTKIICALAIAGALFVGCGTTSGGSKNSYNPGTYTGSARGYNGPVDVEVTFTSDSISDIAISSRETEHVGDSAFGIMIPQILDANGTGVDIVSGATFSSFALKAAIEQAAEQAGADMAKFRSAKLKIKPQAKIKETYDIVIIGAGGAGMAAAAQAAQNGSTVLVLEKGAEMGGNTLVAGGSFQSVQDYIVWDPKDPDATEGVFAETGETIKKAKSDAGRLATLRTIANWSEKSFDGTINAANPNVAGDIEELARRGVHQEYLPTLRTLKNQIAEYMDYANTRMARGMKETDLTVFSTIELHIFQTYYGGLRPNAEGTRWIYGNYDLVSQFVSQAPTIKPWLIAQGGEFNNKDSAGTLIGCLWQRINRFNGGNVDGKFYPGKWGIYFKVPENTMKKANTKNKLMVRTTAKELITSSGRVTGVKAVMWDGTEVEATATKGVIIATGGFGANIPMVQETNDYWKSEYISDKIGTTNRSLATGDGIVMAQKVGADVAGMEWTQMMPLGWVDNGNLSGGTGENVIYINPTTGKRYVDEAAERDVLSLGAFQNGRSDGRIEGIYIELGNGDGSVTASMSGNTTGTSNTAKKVDVEGRIYYRDLAGTAKLLNLSEDVLRQTITEYDAYIIGASNTPSEPVKSAFRGTIGSCDKDANGNYIPSTYRIGTLQIRYMAPSTHHTMGGLVVDTERHVLDKNGKAIPGLFAAGEVTSGFMAGNRLGGNAITEIIVSGRIAAQTASKN